MSETKKENLNINDGQLIVELKKIREDLLNLNTEIVCYVSSVINQTLNKKNYKFTLDDVCLNCLNPIQDKIKNKLKELEFLSKL